MYPYRMMTPEGTRDRLDEDCLRRKQVTQVLEEQFVQRGFRQVATPTLEFYDVFGQGAPHLALEDMYKTTDVRGRLLTLRSDATIPIARLVSASFGQRERPLRLYYAQNVYRVEHQLRGRPHQIFQMGAELLGAGGERSDLEMVELAIKGLDAIGGRQYRMELCHIGYFKSLMEALDADEDTKECIRLSIEKKNYPALRDALEPFGDAPAAKALQYLPRLFGGKEVFERAYGLFSGSKGAAALDELSRLCGHLDKLGCLDRVIFDLGLVNQAEYYTGIIFRGYFDGVGEMVLSGGRYDNLLADFGTPMEAIGFAYNVDLLAGALAQPEMPGAQALVYAREAFLASGLRYRQNLLDQGIPAEFCVLEDLGQARTYGQRKGFWQLHIVGDTVQVEELTDGEV